jgi:hypothetical protein
MNYRVARLAMKIPGFARRLTSMCCHQNSSNHPSSKALAFADVDDRAKFSVARLSTILAEARASRTHRCPIRTTAGFEDREDHRIPSASIE